MPVSDNLNDDFLFIDDSDEEESSQEYLDAWQILIVDDEPEVHSVTQLALSGLIVLDKRIEYLHAYSGKEACQIIADNPEIVLVLLDVVMETDDAGLIVVKYIRETLDKQDIRIVLRTGQPGFAPEESVIKEYDINDYKTKTELTRSKLVTTVYAAIRSYQQISTVDENRLGLEKIISGTSDILELRTISSYSQEVLSQLESLLNVKLSAVFCARGQGIIEGADDLSFYTIAQLGISNAFINKKLDALENAEISHQVKQCFIQKTHQLEGKSICLFVASGGFRAIIQFTLPYPLGKTQKQLLEVFISSVASGYENVHLFQKLRNAAYKDWLTHFPNRLEFVRLLDLFALKDCNNEVAALIDISHFSDINDGLGQEVGNQLLISVAQRIQKMSGSKCQFARVGADIFGIIGSVKCVTLDTLNNIFTQPFIAGEQRLQLSAYFGLCTKKNANSSGVKILNQINIALNLAKKNSKVNFAYYNSEMEDETQWRLAMISQLRTDFADNRLELWYQPQLNLASRKVIGAEALLRWKTKDGSFISPAVFIPLAEYSGLIIDIGEWVVNQACHQIKYLEDSGFDHISISVNVSIPQFRQANFVDIVMNAIQIHQVEPSKLELEITENILMDDPQAVIDALVQFKSQGISIALDDFGTGFSSLSYLQKLPFDRLKVDRTFVTDLDKEGLSILAETIINLGQKMNLKVIAEGIETEAEHQRLIELGCDEVQGFYYAKPMPADKFLQFLQNHK